MSEPAPELEGNVAEAYDLIAPRYDSIYSNALAFAENCFIFDWLREHGYLRGRVLDLGCGTGLLLDWCAQWVPPSCYLGVDISEGMVAEAHRKHPDYCFRQFDLDTAWRPKWPIEEFDSALALFAVPSHLRDLEVLLRRMRENVVLGGSLVLMPFGPAEVGRDDSKFVDGQGRPVHAERWEPDELRGLLERNGFEVEALFPFTRESMHHALKRIRSALSFLPMAHEYRSEQALFMVETQWEQAIFLVAAARRRR